MKKIYIFDGKQKNLKTPMMKSYKVKKRNSQDRGGRIHSVRIYWFNTLTNIQWILAKSQA